MERVLEGRSNHVIFTDPPYGVRYEGKTQKRLTITNDNAGDQSGAFLSAACNAMLPVNSGAIDNRLYEEQEGMAILQKVTPARRSLDKAQSE